MLRATAKPRFRVSRSSESVSLRTKNVTAAETSPITITPKVMKIRAWRPARGRRGPSVAGASPFFIAPRPREAELLHGQRRDSQGVHFQSHDLFAQSDEAGRIVKRHEGSFAKDQLLGALVGALAQRGVLS